MIYETKEELRAAFPGYVRELEEITAGMWKHGGIEFEG